MKESLEAKETKKKTDRTILFPSGKGVVPTAPDFKARKEEQAQRKKDKAERTVEGRMKRAEKRIAQEELLEEWNQIKAIHKASVLKWEAECERLTTCGTKKKDLPKKPIRPPKPKPKVTLP